MPKHRTLYGQIREQTAGIRDTVGDAPLKVKAAEDLGRVAPGSSPPYLVDDYPPKKTPRTKEEE